MKKTWKYMCIPKYEDGKVNHSNTRFNQWGETGWELVGFDADGDAWFKRPVERDDP